MFLLRWIVVDVSLSFGGAIVILSKECLRRRIELARVLPALFSFLFSPLPLLLMSPSLFLSLSPSSLFARINSTVQNYRGTSANGAAKVASKKRPTISASYKNTRERCAEPRLVGVARSSSRDTTRTTGRRTRDNTNDICRFLTRDAN